MMISKMKFGIIGNGFVGKATQQLESTNASMYIYDINPSLCVPAGLTLDRMAECDVIFVCVPTPMEASGKCHLGIVESVISQLDAILDPTKNFVVLRSTVPVGTCDRLGCYFMPEFLTEKNYIQDFIHCEHWVFGLLQMERDAAFKEAITTLMNHAVADKRIMHGDISFRTNKEAEMIKYFRNCYLSTKISFCNEVAEFCERHGMEYENVRSFATLDKRIGPSHSFVPGHDGKRGFGGTCFPKDTGSLLHQMNAVGMKSYVMDAVVVRNNEVDRNEKDWNDNKGRAVI